jgi:hypothetical protein
VDEAQESLMKWLASRPKGIRVTTIVRSVKESSQ